MKINNLRLSEDKNDEEQDPTVFLWLNYYLAQNYLFKSDFQKALEYVNIGIDHTPTVIELYTLKSKIYQKAGNKELSSKFYEEARLLDLADRHLNAKSSRYLLRVDETEKAQ